MEKIGRFLQHAEMWLGSLCLCLMLSIMLFGAFCRYFLERPIFWVEEANNFLFVWMGYLGFAYVMGNDAHIKVTLVESRLPSGIRRAARIIGNAIVVTTCFWLVWPTIRVLPMLHISAAMRVPEKYVYAILPISFLLMGFHALNNFFREIRASSISGKKESGGKPE
ncbi:MAG: TRAP transporter small permease [Planctomycetes bacterium]|nr:TRAP transporter small permease [Planctomycetota bacterium]